MEINEFAENDEQKERKAFSFAIFQLCFYLDFRYFYRFNISDVRNHSIRAKEKRKLLKYCILLHIIYIHTFIALQPFFMLDRGWRSTTRH